MGQMIPCPFQLNEPVRVECIIEELVHRRARKSELLLEGFVVFVTPRYFVFSYTEAMLDVYDLKDHIETRIELINECVEMIENLHLGEGTGSWWFLVHSIISGTCSCDRVSS